MAQNTIDTLVSVVESLATEAKALPGHPLHNPPDCDGYVSKAHLARSLYNEPHRDEANKAIYLWWVTEYVEILARFVRDLRA